MSDNLTVFYQFGFKKSGSSGEDHVVGNCIFCGKEKFYINKETKKWDCKVCGKSGGFKSFIDEAYKMCKKDIDEKAMNDISRHRKIRVGTFDFIGLGYNSLTESYIIPNRTADGKEILNLIHYNLKEKLPRSTAGCHVGIYGWERIQSHHNTIWLCEGVWDWLAMLEILIRLKKMDHVAVGAPGANTFKDEWAHLFKGKNVIVVYDKDVPDARGKYPGTEGCKRVRGKIFPVVESLKFVHFPGRVDEKLDLRDYYISKELNARNTIMGLRSMLRTSIPAYGEEQNDVSEIDNAGKELKKDKPIKSVKRKSAKEIYSLYKKWLHLPDTKCIDIMFGSVLANRLEGDPIWIFFVAPPGGTKSELINSLSNSANIEPLSSLNPHTLISGMKFEGGGDPSLLPKLNGKILLISDFTVILSMNKISRDEILGVLRDAYGGSYSQPYGNGLWRKYKSKFGIIAAVTPLIEQYIDDHVALGERFLRYNMKIESSIAGRKAFITKALENSLNEDRMRLELKTYANSVVNDKNINLVSVVSKPYVRKIAALAQLTSMFRGTVLRDKYSKEVIQRPFIELGTRLAKQFCKLMRGILLFKGSNSAEAERESYESIKAVALSSIPGKTEYILSRMVLHGVDMDYKTADIGLLVQLPNLIVSRSLEDLNMVGILEKIKVSPMTFVWKIKDDVKEILTEAEMFVEEAK